MMKNHTKEKKMCEEGEKSEKAQETEKKMKKE
jgi:hypothetical protein